MSIEELIRSIGRNAMSYSENVMGCIYNGITDIHCVGVNSISFENNEYYVLRKVNGIPNTSWKVYDIICALAIEMENFKSSHPLGTYGKVFIEDDSNTLHEIKRIYYRDNILNICAMHSEK